MRDGVLEMGILCDGVLMKAVLAARPVPSCAWLFLVFLFGLPSLLPLLSPVPARSADGLLHLFRLVQLETLWRNGIFFSRWLPDLAFGYGLPLFNYYAPLVYYLTTPLHVLGMPYSLALNLSLAAALVLGAVGTFFLALELLARLDQTSSTSLPLAASVAALAFLDAPYILFNALHRANLAEQWALAAAPFALWRLAVLARSPRARHFLSAVLTFSAVLLSHNVTAFLFAPLLASFGISCLVSFSSRVRVAAVALAAAFGLSLALTAFFWLPALLEREYVQITRLIVTPDFDYRFNFVSPFELVAPLPRADTGRMNPSFPATLGVVQTVLALGGITTLIFAYRRRAALPLFWLAAAALGLTVLMLAVSQPLWDAWALLAFVQLPMRMRGLIALCLAPLAGCALMAFPPRMRAVVTGAVIAALALTALPMLYPRPARDVPPNPTLNDMFLYEARTGAIGTTSFGEYLPVWVQNPPDESPMAEEYAQGRLPDRFVLPENAEICGSSIYPTEQIVCVSAPEAWRAVYRAFYFPGWRAYVNGRAVPIAPTPRTGLITFDVSGGDQSSRQRAIAQKAYPDRDVRWRVGESPRVVRVVYEETQIERLANWISLAALAGLGVIALGMIATRRGKPINSRTIAGEGAEAVEYRHSAQVSLRPGWGALTLLALALVAFKLWYADRLSNPFVVHFDGTTVEGMREVRLVRFDDELQLLGFDLASRRVSHGETLRTTLYWRALTSLKVNRSVFVHLTTPEGMVRAQKDNLHPANLPTTRWDVDGYVADVHAFTIPGELAPGEYELRAGVYDAETNRRVRTHTGEDYVLLAKIIVE